MTKINSLPLISKIIVLTGITLLSLTSQKTAKAVNFSVIADSLDSPRGLTFGADNSLYVVEAGRGGDGACIPSPSIPGAVLCEGNTGAVTRIQNGTSQRVLTGLPSIASLGSSELPDGADASGAHDLAFDNNGNAYLIFGLASNPANRPLLNSDQFGKIFTVDLVQNQVLSEIADLAQYEQDNNPDGGDPNQGGINSNPYALAIQGNTIFAIDSGGNDLLHVNISTGDIQTAAVFPTQVFPGFPFPSQSVPTGVTIGLDNNLYVSELTGFPFPVGGARIYQTPNNSINNNNPDIYLQGFTNLIDLAFGNNGNLYALEFAANSILSGDPTGALIEIKPNGDRRTILSEGLINPTALTIDQDNNIYISNQGFIAGTGQVIKIENNDLEPASTPESSSILGLLSIGLIGVISQMKKSSHSK